MMVRVTFWPVCREVPSSVAGPARVYSLSELEEATIEVSGIAEE